MAAPNIKKYDDEAKNTNDDASWRRVPFPNSGYHSSWTGQARHYRDSAALWWAEEKEARSHYTALDWAGTFLPCIQWIREYDVKRFLVWDLIAGISVGAMVVPQGMSYATLAGLPTVFGLYGAFVPCLLYSFVGSSKQLAVGPVAVTSLLLSTGLQGIIAGSADISNANSPQPDQVDIQTLYNHSAVQIAFIVSLMYTGIGILRLGFIIRLLSHSVISGFTTGAAIIIGLSQVKYLLGYSVPRNDPIQLQLNTYLAAQQNFRWEEWTMGVTLLIFLLATKVAVKAWPRAMWPKILKPFGPLIAAIIGIIAVVAGNLDTRNIKIVASIPSGLPSPTVSWWFPMNNGSSLAGLAVIITLVDLLESTSIARALALRNGYTLDFNREIIGLGLANFGGAIFHSYTTTGSFSRSAVNNDSGAKSPLANFITSMVVMFVLLFLTPVFEKLPYNVIGAIIISGCAALFDWEYAVLVSKVRLLDLATWLASFLGVMFAGVEIGLAIAIGLAVLIILVETAFPHTAVLGRIPGTTVYRNVEQYQDAQELPGTLLIRIDAPLYFANVQWVQDQVFKYIERRNKRSAASGEPLVSQVVLDLSPVARIDSVGAHFMEELLIALRKRDIQLVLANPNAAVMRVFERIGFGYKIGYENIFARTHDAVAYSGPKHSDKLQKIETV